MLGTLPGGSAAKRAGTIGRPPRLYKAERELACRAGTETAYPWGDNPDDGDGFANAADQTAKRQFPHLTAFSWDDGFVYTAPVGSFKPNAWGLYDMIGTALEGCSDYYGDYPDGFAVDPKGPGN